MRRFERLATGPGYRSVQFLRFFRNGAVHQWASTTALDRYPDVFARCAHHSKEVADLRILSFGCSTGEEVITLRSYFPKAHLVGVDVNRHSSACAGSVPIETSAWNSCSRITRSIREKGPYDAVFCMAVFQRPQNRQPARTQGTITYSFARFERALTVLDAALKPAGLLVLDHTDYRFIDTDIASKYDALDQGSGIARQRPHFDRNGRRGGDSFFNPRIFQKRARAT